MSAWKFIIHMVLLLGYIIDPYHIAWYIGRNRVPELAEITEEPSVIFELVADILLTINIIICFLTAYEDEMKPVKELRLIAYNYAKGYLLFDLLATIPGYFVMM